MAFKTYAPTKAQQMRAIAAKIQESGRRPTPKDLIEEMAKKGVTISSGHASVVLRKFTGKRCRRRGARAAQPGKPHSKPVAVKRDVDPFWLVSAAKFVKSCGGFKQARGRIAVLEDLLNVVNEP